MQDVGCDFQDEGRDFLVAVLGGYLERGDGVVVGEAVVGAVSRFQEDFDNV